MKMTATAEAITMPLFFVTRRPLSNQTRHCKRIGIYIASSKDLPSFFVLSLGRYSRHILYLYTPHRLAIIAGKKVTDLGLF